MSPGRRLVAAASLLASAAAGEPASAQPAPAVRTTCGEIRAALAALPPDKSDIVTIEVTGPLAAVTSGEALSFLVVCSPPDIQVACAAYATEGRQPGQPTTVVGAIQPGPRDRRILLDPCIHFGAKPPP